jgi:hypothetical protein
VKFREFSENYGSIGVRNTIRLIVVYSYGKIYGTSTEC